MKGEFLIIDGHSIAHRAYHALKTPLTAPDGTPTGVIVGFLNMVLKVEEEYKPSCVVVFFDAGGKNFRHDLLPSYKSGRKTQESDLKVQLPLLEELLKYLGYNVYSKEGIEADDLAASASRLAEGEGYGVLLLSSDKDLFQVIGGGVRMLRPVKKGVQGAELYDEKSFKDEYKFAPSSMADYLAITGDVIDNIPGVRGIGDVGAKKLLSEYENVEGIFGAIEKIPEVTRKKLLSAGLENVLKTREITRLKYDVLEKGFIEECVKFKADISGAVGLASRLGLAKLLRRINPDGAIKAGVKNLFDFTREQKPLERFILDDYKTVITKGESPLMSPYEVWDLRTGYYLLHPDVAEKRFAGIISEIKSADRPGEFFLKIASSLEAEINSYEGLKDVMKEIDTPLIPVLVEMERHGIRLDDKKFLTLQRELEDRILNIENEIIEQSGHHINLNSSQQVSWLLFEQLGFEPEGMTKGKTSYSTEASVLERLAKKPEGVVPALILEHRELSKMLTGFVMPLQRAAFCGGIIHTTFEGAMTGTGRLSSREPNLQNIPAFGEWAEKIKAGLVPVEAGNIFVSADYSQIELRVLAYMSKEGRLIEAFEKGRDIHRETASWVFGIVPEMVTNELRRAAKMINFGLLYGMGTFGLSERLSISRSEASEIIAKYFKALPCVKDFLKGIVEGAKRRGYSRTLAGRIRPVREIPARGAALDRALINSPIQGTAADIARRAMIDYAEHGAGKLLLQVHDSLVCECKESEADEVAEGLREIMKGAGGELPLEVEVKRGVSLAGV